MEFIYVTSMEFLSKLLSLYRGLSDFRITTNQLWNVFYFKQHTHWGNFVVSPDYLVYVITLAVYHLKFYLDFLTYSGKVFLYAETTSNETSACVTVFLADSWYFLIYCFISFFPWNRSGLLSNVGSKKIYTVHTNIFNGIQ